MKRMATLLSQATVLEGNEKMTKITQREETHLQGSKFIQRR